MEKVHEDRVTEWAEAMCKAGMRMGEYVQRCEELEKKLALVLGNTG